MRSESLAMHARDSTGWVKLGIISFFDQQPDATTLTYTPGFPVHIFNLK